MSTDISAPTFLIEIQGQALLRDITHEITSFVYEDNEDEMDVMEVTVADRYLRFVDSPLFQEGNDIAVRFGYAGDLCAKKIGVIREIEYDFPDAEVPTIKLKAYDKGVELTGKARQKVWQKPAPGITYSEIAEAIAKEHGLTPVVKPSVGRHLRVAQSGISDAQFLKQLAAKARDRDGKGTSGYVFYVQGSELHFHPRNMESRPQTVFEYFTDRHGVLRSFTPATQTQEMKGAGTETKAVGVDPRKKSAVEHRAGNATTQDRTALGKHTALADGDFESNESGKIVPSFGRSESVHNPSEHAAEQSEAESAYKSADLRQVEARALTIGMPALSAKENIEIRGVGAKFSGVWHVVSVRHIFEDGYSCEIKLVRNAVGKTAGKSSAPVKARKNEQEASGRGKPKPASFTPKKPQSPGPVLKEPDMVRIDANTGRRL